MGGGKSPKMPPPLPPPPTLSDTEVEDQRRRQREKDRKRKGRSSTILTGPLGVSDQAPVQKKTLLGQ